jgi:3D (Asp-Asp-Asp) domain-containing protein
MYLSRSFGRKIVATALAAVSFAFLYEATVLDSRFAGRQELSESTATAPPGARLRFSATAYCKGTTTASGVNVRSGIAASDPDLLPVGSVVQIGRLGEKYDGVYTVMDTGPKVQGRHLDLYMWSCYEALEFGRRPAEVTVLRLGWSPRTSKPGLIDRLFHQRESAAPPPAPASAEPTGPLPSRPITQTAPVTIPQ